MAKHQRKRHSIEPGRRIALPLACLAVLLLMIARPVNAQPTGYQEYYVMGYEEHIWRAFLAIYDGSDSDIPGEICSTVSLVATANHQVVYYDHWEDGYEADLFNPLQTTTEIYGDGDCGNGGQGEDVLLAGTALNLTSDQDIVGPTAITGYVPVDPQRVQADMRYDGGDRIITSGGPVDLTHAMWPLDNSWAGGAWEVYSYQAYADTYSYRIPIGEDLYAADNSTYGDFRNVFLQVGAFSDATTVSIDNGSQEVNLTLDRGESYFSQGLIGSTSAPTITINAGTVVLTNKPIQVGLVTGADSPGGVGFQGRFFILLPEEQWGADYVVPVPGGYSPFDGRHVPSEIYLANPNDFPITVQANDQITSTTFEIGSANSVTSTVAFSGTVRGPIPPDSAVRFTSADGVFGLVTCVDTAGTAYDWGFAGIPTKYLTQDYYISWAPGTTDLSHNGSPVWVTPAEDGTVFYVDHSPLDGQTDETFVLDVLEQRRIFDHVDNDNTGMHIWATDEFAVIWGEDPQTANVSDPYLDLGVTTLPLQQRWLNPVFTLDKTAQPTTLPPAGGTVTFTLVAQTYNTPLVDVVISDTLPISWTYVTSSTHVSYPGGATDDPEPDISGRNLTWDLDTSLNGHDNLTLTFQAALQTPGSVGTAAYDGFESNTYSGGGNWVGDWQEDGESDGPSLGDVTIDTAAPFVEDRHLSVSGPNRALSRTVDLSEFALPVLRFAWQLTSVEVDDHFYLDIFNGNTWTTVLSPTSTRPQGVYLQETIDLRPYAADSTAIRFRSDGDIESDDFLYIDEVTVYDGMASNVNQGEAIGRHEYSGSIFNPTDEATIHVSFLDLLKSVDQEQAGIGDTLVYSLTYTNRSGTITATDVVLRDAVPIQYVTFQQASDGGVYDPAKAGVFWNLGSLPPLASDSVTFTVKINPFVEDGTILEDKGYIDSDQTIEIGSNVARTTVRVAQIAFTKSGPTAVYRGDVMTYTLSYENTGGTDATGVVISDTLPDAVTYVPGSLSILTDTTWITLSDAYDGDCGTHVGGTVVITPGTVGVEDSGHVRFCVQVTDTLPSGSSILNAATLDRDLDIPRESNLAVTYISDLLITKAAEQEVVAPRGTISYTITYQNVSTTTAQTNVSVREAIPQYTSLISGTAYGGDSIEYSWDHGLTWQATPPITPVTHVRWRDAIVPTETQVTVGLAVRVNASLLPDTTIENVATISSTQAYPIFGGWIASNPVLVETVDLWVNKSANQPLGRASGTISYTLACGNRGTADALGVKLTDLIPANATYNPGSIWGVGADDGGKPLLTWDVMTLPAGSSAPPRGYSVTLDEGLDHGDVVTNTATISNGLETQTSQPVVVTIGADLSIAKTGQPESAVCGTTLTYTLAYANNGPSDVDQVTVTDTLPVSVTYGGMVSAPWGPATPSGRQLTWHTPTLMAGERGQIVFTVTVDGDATGTLTNTATIAGNTYDPNTDNDQESVTTAMERLDIEKTAIDLAGAPLYVGDGIAYRVVVNNASPYYTHHAVAISDSVPVSTTLVPGSVACPAEAACDSDGSILTATVSHLGPGEVLTLTFEVSVDQGAGGRIIVNQARVTSDQQHGPSQSTPTGNPVSVLVPGISMDKQVTPDASTKPDRWVQYIFRVTNVGDVGLNSISIWDDQISGVTHHPLLVPDIAVGQTVTVTRWWKVNLDTHNVATVTALADGLANPISAVAEADYDFVCGQDLTLHVSAEPTVIPAPQTVTYTYQVINVGEDYFESGTISDTVYGLVAHDLTLAPGESFTQISAHTVTTTTTNVVYLSGADRLGTPFSRSTTTRVFVGEVWFLYLPVTMRGASP